MRIVFILLLAFVTSAPVAGQPRKVLSHPPIRPLPKAGNRPLENSPTFFVDATHGSDGNDGSKEKPWQTVQRGVNRLKPGDTLCLRGGRYYEHVAITISGTDQKPITVRAYPGELAILDGGLREFFDDPAKAWEVIAGSDGEFRSTKAYSDLGGEADSTNVLGNFGDSMVSLHGYRFGHDLRDKSLYWDLKDRFDKNEGIYCGPGLFYEVKTGYIHARLAHTDMKQLGNDNYRGETDPRKLSLVIAGGKKSPLTLQRVRNVRVQDLVLRGSLAATLRIVDSARITLDGMTIYGGAAAIEARDTHGLRVLNTACRGIAAPWTFRGSLKYRAFEARIFSTGGWSPTGNDNRDFELAYSEFTDCVDGIFLGNVQGVRFHHNLVDNISDDGIFLTAGTGYDGTTPGGDVHIYQNLLSRCLTTFAFGVGHGRQKMTRTGPQTGSGVYIFRNVFDFRRSVMYHTPTSPDDTQALLAKGRFASDHGSPAWEPMTIYHNTVLADDPAAYAYGTHGLGDHVQKSRRRIFNNIVVQVHGLPGTHFPPVDSDFQADGNLFWSLHKQPAGDPFAKFRLSKDFAASKARYAAGWSAHDRFADPRFSKIDATWQKPLDLRLDPGSPAIDAGVALPRDWPDPLRSADKGKPDLGAVPHGLEPCTIGVWGRSNLFRNKEPAHAARTSMPPLPWRESPEREPKHMPAALIEGYPAFDAPLLDFALKRQGVRVDRFEKSWLAPRDYDRYAAVIITGNLVRASIKPNRYDGDDLIRLQSYLQRGGTLLVSLAGKEVFGSDEAQKFLKRLTGEAPRVKDIHLTIREPGHPWVKHLRPGEKRPWLTNAVNPQEFALPATQGERIIAGADGHAILYRLRVGKGQLIFLGWQLHDSLPRSRPKPSTVEAEEAFEDQTRVLFNIIREIYP